MQAIETSVASTPPIPPGSNHLHQKLQHFDVATSLGQIGSPRVESMAGHQETMPQIRITSREAGLK